MKKLLSTSSFTLILFALACNNKSDSAGALSAGAQKNLDAMHAITQCFTSKDFSKLGDYIATDAVDHSGEKGDIVGLDSLKTEFAKWTAAVTQKTEVIKELADDEWVMSWEHDTGTYDSAAMGHKPGDKFDMKVIEVAKFKDGKATEHWSMMEPADLMKMMGGGADTKMAMPADSSKMSPSKK
jgi:predicted ester cyclase